MSPSPPFLNETVADIKPITIRGRRVGPREPPFVIAEIAANHQGDFGLAKKMIQIAAAMGAEAAKFQLHIVEDEMLRELPPWENLDEPLWDLLTRTHFDEKQHKELMKHCDAMGIQYLCTPFSRAAADILEDNGVAAFKVGSGELTNLPLQKHIAKKGLPMIISTGMSTEAEVQETADLVRGIKTPHMLMHCVSAYPAPYDRVNLGVIPRYLEKFQVPVGLSDHSLGIYTSLGGVAQGACAFEKHFTLDRGMHGPDHRASIEPDELGELTKGVRAVFDALGDKREILDVEREVVAWARESVVTVKPIKKGQTITKDHVWVKRPGPGKEGIPAKELDLVIGKKAKVDLQADRQVRRSDIA
jgi:N-acetylneuraminate synthase